MSVGISNNNKNKMLAATQVLVKLGMNICLTLGKNAASFIFCFSIALKFAKVILRFLI